MNANYYIGTYLCFYASNPPSYPKQLCGKCNHFEKCFNFLFKKKDMETKELKIEIPEDYEIDSEHSSFEKIVFKKKEKSLPKSWIELAVLQENHTFHLGCEILNYNGYSSVFVPDKYAAAIAALNKLIRLRDYYNDGWVPDWNDNIQEKYYISIIGDDIRKDSCWSIRNILSFKDKKTRDEFYNNFKDLIEQTKELI